METLNYDAMEQEIIGFIDKNKIMVVATSANDRVTARMMSVIHDGLKIYFQASTNSGKYQQIMKNANVALCIGNMQMEGVAEIIGHPYDVAFFNETYSKIHEGSYRTYSCLTCSRVVEVKPRFITFWKYGADGQPYRDFVDIANRKAWREVYLENP